MKISKVYFYKNKIPPKKFFAVVNMKREYKE